ncbi:MAG: glycosyltransferase family 4 protein [Anaerolineaceae bacterium]|nr:glycosyltransferase family 4 protein [Anaerolineaceae bacterium]
MPGRLLLFNIRTDADDHILGFTTAWINALAAHYDAVDVLTMHAGRLAVAQNVTVYSVGREHGYSPARRLVAFYWILLRLLLTRRYTACFAHMMPLFAALGGVPLRLAGVPLTTWYTHRQVTPHLKWALRFSRRVVSAVPESFPIPTPKLRVTGHGVNTGTFCPPPEDAGQSRPLVLQVARLMPIKHQETLLRAAAPLDCDVALVGGIPDGANDSYEKTLRALAGELGIAHKVTFAGEQTAEQVRDWYWRAAVAVNLSPPGLFDKAALEGMACALPTITSSAAFTPLTGTFTNQLLLATPQDSAGLTVLLRGLLAQSPQDRRAIGLALRQAVIEQHSLDSLILRLVNVLNTGEL